MSGRGLRWGAGVPAAALLLAATLTSCTSRERPVEPPPTPAQEVPRAESPERLRLPLRRLTHAQYDKTVRDLLGDHSHPARAFPADDTSHGFDNMAEVLSLSPLLVEKYDAAAEQLASAAWDADHAAPYLLRAQAEELPGTLGVRYDEVWQLNGNGSVDLTFEVPSSGTYVLAAFAGATKLAGEAPPHMVFRVDGKQVAEFDVEAEATVREVHQVSVALTAGRHAFTVHLDNYLWSEAQKAARSLVADWLQVDRAERSVPFDQARVRVCDPVVDGSLPCARRILERFARRAFRRTVTAEEVERLVTLVEAAEKDGLGFAAGIQNALHAVLLSPNFLFRVELDGAAPPGEQHPVTDEELATRLSYFLWSSTPDDTLLDLAASGALSQPPILEAQVTRMLADERAEALVEDFAGQWLQLRQVPEHQPDPVLHPEVNAALKEDMKNQTAMLFREFLRQDRDLLGLLDTDITFLNDRLARHYGLPLPGSEALVRTAVSDPRRTGLLSQASVLMLTSPPDHTSPVLRGKWVLENVLCQAPPPPPPDIPPLPTAQGGAVLSKRQQVAQHRADPGCNGCHSLMDPVGFGFENFDAVGRWRDVDEAGHAVDPAGVLPDGTRFGGPTELVSTLKSNPAVPACITRKLFVYGTSRSIEANDRAHLEELTQGFAQRGHRLSELIQLFVKSRPFTHR